MPTSTKFSFEQLSDESLIQHVAQGEPAALEVLYDRYAAAVLGICMRMTGNQTAAEDALQEIFWHVWQRAARDENQQGSFSGWLFRLTRRLAREGSRDKP